MSWFKLHKPEAKPQKPETRPIDSEAEPIHPEFIYAVMYNGAPDGEWILFDGVFVTEKAAREAESFIHNDFYGRVKIKIEKRKIYY